MKKLEILFNVGDRISMASDDSINCTDNTLSKIDKCIKQEEKMYCIWCHERMTPGHNCTGI
jgi:hypothetical protein